MTLIASFRIDTTTDGFTLTPIEDDGFGNTIHNRTKARTYGTFPALAGDLEVLCGYADQDYYYKHEDPYRVGGEYS